MSISPFHLSYIRSPSSYSHMIYTLCLQNIESLKLNQASQAAWNSAGSNSITNQFPPPPSQTQPNGNSHSAPAPPNTSVTQGAPPGVSAPPPGQTPSTYAAANGTDSHPETPAQQILMSAADRWGLLGLLAMIKSAGSELDQGLSSIGTDLGTIGLDMGFNG